MSVFVIFLSKTLDTAKLSLYATQALPMVTAHGGTMLSGGQATFLNTSSDFDHGVVFEFPDRASVTAWYDSEEYQALAAVRSEAMKCSIVVLG